MPIDYDLEDALALQKLKEAAVLRRSPLASPTTSTGAVNWLGAVNRFQEQNQGNRAEDQAIARQRELAQQQQAEVDAYNKAIQTPGVKLRQGQGPLLDPTEPMSPEEENQRQMGLSMDAMRLPKARGMAEQFVKSGVGFPEKQAQLAAQQALAREQQAARLAAQQQQAAMLEEGRRQRSSDSNALRMTIAGMAAANRGDGTDADLKRELLQAKIDKLREGPKPTAAESKEATATKKALASGDRLEGLIKEADVNQEAFGIVPAVASMLPNVIGSRITSKTLTEPQQVSRAKVMTEGAKAIHDIYGAALSRGEAARADTWAPNPNDDYPTIVRKMKAAQQYARSIAGRPSPEAVAPSAGGNEEWVRGPDGKLVRK